MIGAVTRTNQAPSVNLTTEKIKTIASETDPAAALIATLIRHPLGFVRRECFVIPKPASVKPVKTPKA